MLFNPANELARPFNPCWISHLDELPNPQVIHSDHLAIGQRNCRRPIIATNNEIIVSLFRATEEFFHASIFCALYHLIRTSYIGKRIENILLLKSPCPLVRWLVHPLVHLPVPFFTTILRKHPSHLFNIRGGQLQGGQGKKVSKDMVDRVEKVDKDKVDKVDEDKVDEENK